MTRIFATTILPEHIIAKHKLSFAACNFSSNLISGNGFDKVYSTMPVYVEGEMDAEAYADRRFELIYSKLRKKGSVISKIAPFVEQWTLFRKIPPRSSIWLYNISMLNAFLYILLRTFKRNVQLNVIVLDFTPPVKKLSKSGVFLWLINKSHGIIKLANSELFTNRNSCCLAGVTPKEDKSPLITERKHNFLLSGVLQPDISSIPMILDAFAECPDYRLYITGSFSDTELMSRYTENYSNIVYLGVLKYSEYQDLLHSVSFQLSLRNPLWADNTCNFPSKIIEALLHNRGVVSTMSYEQIEGINYIKTERTVKGFIKTLNDIANMDDTEWFKYVNQGTKVSGMFSTIIWNKEMKLIESKK